MHYGYNTSLAIGIFDKMSVLNLRQRAMVIHIQEVIVVMIVQWACRIM